MGAHASKQLPPSVDAETLRRLGGICYLTHRQEAFGDVPDPDAIPRERHKVVRREPASNRENVRVTEEREEGGEVAHSQQNVVFRCFSNLCSQHHQPKRHCEAGRAIKRALAGGRVLKTQPPPTLIDEHFPLTCCCCSCSLPYL